MVDLPEILHNIETIEEDVDDVNKKCNKIQCSYIYDAIKSIFKLIFDLLICKPKPKSI